MRQKFVIQRIGSSPEQFFRTKGLNRLESERPKIKIRGQKGIWSDNLPLARRYGCEGGRSLPAGCKFVPVDSGTTENGNLRKRKRKKPDDNKKHVTTKE